MALRSFVTIDSKDLIVTFSSSVGLVGNSIIITSDIPDGTVFTYTSTSGQWLTRDDTGTNVDIIEDGDTSGHVINDGARHINNGNGVEAGSLIKVRALDEVGIPTGPAITITLFSQIDRTGNVWRYAADFRLVDGASYVKLAGSKTGSSEHVHSVTCVGPDTQFHRLERNADWSTPAA